MKYGKHAKGISDFISTVLVIAITITMGIVLFNWIEPLSREHADKVSSDSTNKLKCQSAALRITDGKLTLSTDKLSVVAENTGTVDLTGFTFNIILTNGTSVNTAADPAVTLEPATKQTFTTGVAVAEDSDNLTSVRLIGECNSEITIHDSLDGNTFSEVA